MAVVRFAACFPTKAALRAVFSLFSAVFLFGHLDLYGDDTYYWRNHFGGKEKIVPALMEKKDKQCRMDVRLTQSQRAAYERAASLKGQTLTQWATAHLDESARRDIETATTTVLSGSSFDEFCAMLDAPMPKAVQDLLSRKAVWE